MAGYDMSPLQPDWVIVGVTMRHGGVSLFASKTLDRAEFDIDYGDDHIEFRGQYIAPVRYTKITLTCVMRDFVWVQAQNYESAFSKLDDLFKQWTQEYERRGQRILREAKMQVPVDTGATRRSVVSSTSERDRPKALPPGGDPG